jgi:hypothetical protein
MAFRAIAVAAAVVVLVVIVAYAGIYVAYFVAAMQRPAKPPFTIACTQVASPNRTAINVRFDVASTAPKDATFLNFALFAQPAYRRNLSDWGYALRTRIPARSRVSTIVAIPLPPDYAGLKFSALRCNLINAAFADGSQQDYTANTGMFP